MRYVMALLLLIMVPAKQPTIGSHCLLPRPVLLAQEGNPGHREPPPGWTCSHEAKDEHACSCHRECKDTPIENEDGTPGTSTTVVEDAKCKVYCWKTSCRCPVHNCE